MIRPVAVNALGEELAGLEVAPDLVRVQTQFVTGTGAKTRSEATFRNRRRSRRSQLAELTPELAFALGGPARRSSRGTTATDFERRSSSVATRGSPERCSRRRSSPGITSVGRNVVALGIVPTPAVACVTRREGAAAGVMISASHNPVADNGIKFFGPDGFKLPDERRARNRIAARRSEICRARSGTEIGVARIGAESRQVLLRRTLRERR